MIKNFTVLLIFTLSVLLLSQAVYAHSGRTDSNGGHKCSAASIKKGLCTGYHYHNGGKSSNEKTSNEKASTSKTTKSEPSSTKQATNSLKESNTSNKALKVSTVQLYVNDVKINLNSDTLIMDNANYFPIREISEAIDAKLDYDTNTGEITIKKETKFNTIDSNGKEVIKQNNTTYAALRTILNNLDVKIEHDAKQNIIYLTI